MRKLPTSLLILTLAVSATPAIAAELVFGSGSTASTQGGRIFTAGAGSEAISVRATAWTLKTSDNTISQATLGVWSGTGLGVTNTGAGESVNNNSHTIDNLNGIDFIVLQFDKAVVLGNATFSAFEQSGYNYTDTDATIGFGNTTTAWNANLSLETEKLTLGTLANLNSLIPSTQQYLSGNNGEKGSNTRNIDPLMYAGNVWIVSAAITNPDTKRTKIDSFKFNYLNYTTKMPVPEPATWIMMIAGFGMIGSTMRRRKPVDALINTVV